VSPAAPADKAALVLGDRTLTFGRLDDRSTRLAHGMAALGVGAGDRVAVMLPNSFEFFEAATAASKLDAAVVPVNWHLKTEELAWILADSEARLLVTDEAIWSAVAGVAERVAGCARIVVGTAGTAGYEAIIASAGDTPEPLAAPASFTPVFYTSGTTGRPKGVVHGAFGADRQAIERGQQSQVALWNWTADDVHLLCGPAYHAGPGGWTMTALYIGATTVIMPEWDAGAWLDLVERHRVTRAFMVPAHFIRILEVGAAGRDLSSLHLIVHAAAPCPIAVKRRIIDALEPAEVWELYGMSEGGATRISPGEWLDHPGSVGTPWPGVTIHIVSESGDQLGPEETGLIYVSPPGGARFHYHNDPEKTAGAWRHGREPHGDQRQSAFTVGDIGHLDADGFLYITDRAADMVIRGGVNVYPREVEEVLYQHADVVDCAVFGIPDPRLGERLKAMVELRTGAPATETDLDAWCGERLARFKCPEIIELVDTLPRDPNGKVLKRRLRDAHWGDGTVQVDSHVRVR
jgi:acyl-CoA synthetase (AMP-forming)/AMP-acid ligase II